MRMIRHTLTRSLGILGLILLGLITYSVNAQSKFNIGELMQRRDIRLSEIDALAQKYFEVVGKVRGTGYKQYERWKYEQQFHLDEKGYILPDGHDTKEFLKAYPQYEHMTYAPAGAWNEVGPSYWKRTSSWNPGVGRITSIAVFPPDTNIIYVTSPGGGLWKSTQGGNQWTALSDLNSSMMDLYSVAIDPTNSNRVFTGNNSGNIYRSTDGGATWASISTGMGTVKKILFNPTNPQIMYAAATGIYKSIDGGTTWVKKNTATIEDIEFRPDNTSILYAAGNNILRSIDGGETWTQMGSGNGITTSARTLLAVSAADPLVVYALQNNGGSEFGRLYRSIDGGTTYDTTITGSSARCTNFFGYSANGCGTGGQGWYDMALTVNPLNASEVHIAGIICWKSTNGGKNFVAETEWSYPNATGYNHADVHVLEWVGKTIYSGSDGGIYKSTDNGDNWTELSNGISIRQFYKIATSKTNPVIVTGGAQDNGSSIYNSKGWIDWLGADGMDCLISPLDSNLIWGTSQYGSLYRTTNGGASYSGISNPGSGSWVTPLAIESNSNIIYGGYVGVYRSTDLGDSWVKISDTIIKNNLSSVAVAPSNPQYIYASDGAYLYVTKNGGTNWSTYALTNTTVTSIAIHPTNPEKIWISSSTSGTRVMVSSNAGATFAVAYGNLPSLAARSIVIDDRPEEGLYVAMNLGVYYTNKNMTSWVNLTDNLPQVSINEVEIQKVNGKIRVGTYGRGIWERNPYYTCGATSNLSSSTITSNSATLSWSSVADATGYTVDYKPSSSSTWTNIVANTTNLSTTVNNLIQGTTYDWRVSVACSLGISEYALASFTTSTPCGKPANLSTTLIDTNSATLQWGAVTNATNYNVDFRNANTITWIPVSSTITLTNYKLTGLSQNTNYLWRVSATCPAGTGNTDSLGFTTAYTCMPPTNLTTSNITTNSAALSWSAVTGASGYTVESRLAGANSWTIRITNTTSTSYSLTGLSASTAYDWRVKTYCGTLSGNSLYSLASFTTSAPACVDNFETNNTINTAKALSLNTAVSATMGSGTDQDWFRITSPNTSATNIRARIYNLPADYDLYFYDKNGTLLKSGQQSGTTPDTIIYNSTAKKSNYHIRVISKTGTFNSSTCYSLIAETSSTPYSSTTLPQIISLSTVVENNVSGTWKIYPIPVNSQLNILYNSGGEDQGTILVFDGLGRMLSSRSVEIRSGLNNFMVDMGSMKNGVYLIKMATRNSVITEKVMVQK